MITSKSIVVATHRRSGTHWMLDALRNNSPSINPKFLTLEQIEPSHHQPIPLEDFQQSLQSLIGHVLIKVHDLPTATYWQRNRERTFVESIFQQSRTVYVHRDGRDVMVSLYHYFQSFSTSIAERPFSEFLRMNHDLDGDTDLSRPAFWAHHVQMWMNQPNLIAVSYASLETDYENTLRSVADFLDVRLNDTLQPIELPDHSHKPTLVDRILYRLGIETPKVITSAVQPRKGKSGDWRNYFSDADLDFFMAEAGETMRELGYMD